MNLYQTMPQIGRVEWIGLRRGKRQPMVVVDEVQADVDAGLVGDRFAGAAGSKRMVTLIQAEHLPCVAAILGRDPIDPALLRRNIVVSRINLLALKAPGHNWIFRIGEAILRMSGQCHPCSRMEENLGAGGFNAMRGHGGITATVVEPGRIRLGSEVKMLPPDDCR